MTHTEETADLLSLIGHAIEGLRRSIELLETSQRPDGLLHLGAVIREIDTYLDRIDEDPLLQLAPLPPSYVRSGLDHVRQNITEVIRDLEQRPPR